MDCYVSYLNGHTEDVTSLSLSGKLLASGSEDGTIRIWDTTSHKSVRRLTDPHFYPEKQVENVNLDEYFLSASYENNLYVFDIRNPSKILIHESLWKLSISDTISQINKKASIIGCSLDSGCITLIDTTTKQAFLTIEPHNNVLNK